MLLPGLLSICARRLASFPSTEVAQNLVQEITQRFNPSWRIRTTPDGQRLLTNITIGTVTWSLLLFVEDTGKGFRGRYWLYPEGQFGSDGMLTRTLLKIDPSTLPELGKKVVSEIEKVIRKSTPKSPSAPTPSSGLSQMKSPTTPTPPSDNRPTSIKDTFRVYTFLPSIRKGDTLIVTLGSFSGKKTEGTVIGINPIRIRTSRGTRILDLVEGNRVVLTDEPDGDGPMVYGIERV